MTLARRRFVGFLALGTAGALAGCGGGGDDDRPSRRVFVLNLNADFAVADVAVDDTVVVTSLPFELLSPGIVLEYGVYSIGLRNPASGRVLYFDGFGVDDLSPTVEVFYANGASARLAPSPSGIVNYFDSSEPLAIELEDGNGNVQRTTLGFEASAPQVSQSRDCRLRVRRASDGVLVYDSGVRVRTGAIVIYPADPRLGFVGAIGVNYNFSDAEATLWPNSL